MGSFYTPPVNLASPGPIGGTTPAAGTFTTLVASTLPVNNLIIGGAFAYGNTEFAANPGTGFTHRFSVGNGVQILGIYADYTASTFFFQVGPSTDIMTISASGVTVVSGKALRLGNAATTGLTAGVLAALTNASIVLLDSTGQAYRIPCII